AVDAKIGNAELARIGRLVQTLPAFSGFDPERLTHVAQECGEILQEETGLQTALALIKAGLPEVLRETAYALAVEVAIADRNIAREEIRFLAMLRDALDLSKLQTAALEHAAIARYQSA
ncbi:MAG: tellurite resistance TerB family protein, partial [Pseudomonadota bacterium]